MASFIFVVLGFQDLKAEDTSPGMVPESMHQLMVQYGRVTRLAGRMLREASGNAGKVSRQTVDEVIAATDLAREYSVGVLMNRTVLHLQPSKARNAKTRDLCNSVLTSYYDEMVNFEIALQELQKTIEDVLPVDPAAAATFSDTRLSELRGQLEKINEIARAAHTSTM